eukprot:4052341-Pleurochrysis_carterae.AAC.1
MTRSPPAVRYAAMSQSRCTPLHRSGATTAAVLPRRRMMHSTIVSSSSLACAGVASSFSTSGGDGAMSSTSSVLSLTMLSPIDGGAVGGCVPGICSTLGGAGGECWFSPGKIVSMNRACGET